MSEEARLEFIRFLLRYNLIPYYDFDHGWLLEADGFVTIDPVSELAWSIGATLCRDGREEIKTKMEDYFAKANIT